MVKNGRRTSRGEQFHCSPTRSTYEVVRVSWLVILKERRGTKVFGGVGLPAWWDPREY
jgi:hypothetical protein